MRNQDRGKRLIAVFLLGAKTFSTRKLDVRINEVRGGA